MSVVDLKSNDTYGALDATTGARGLADYAKTRGVLKHAAGKISNASTDNNGSVYRMVTLPSDVILHPDTKIDLQGWGYAAATIGIDTDPDALLPSVTVAGLSAPSAPIAMSGNKWNKPLWEQVGLTEDPDGEITLAIYTAADATGDGIACFDIVYQGN